MLARWKFRMRAIFVRHFLGRPPSATSSYLAFLQVLWTIGAAVPTTLVPLMSHPRWQSVMKIKLRRNEIDHVLIHSGSFVRAICASTKSGQEQLWEQLKKKLHRNYERSWVRCPLYPISDGNFLEHIRCFKTSLCPFFSHPKSRPKLQKYIKDGVEFHIDEWVKLICCASYYNGGSLVFL